MPLLPHHLPPLRNPDGIVISPPSGRLIKKIESGTKRITEISILHKQGKGSLIITKQLERNQTKIPPVDIINRYGIDTSCMENIHTG